MAVKTGYHKDLATPEGSTLTADPAPTRFIGRQPILDSRLKLFGHELLFRSGSTNSFVGDGEHATQSVIDTCLLLMPSDGFELSFLNCTREALMSGLVTLLPPSRTILEILEGIDPDPALLDVCRVLRKSGYRFALDDFPPDHSKMPFLEIAEFIKVDFMASDAEARREIYRMAAGTSIRFIAEKLETEADVEIARSEGCGFFQGYFFCKPMMLATRSIPENKLVYIRLLVALTRTPSNISEIERLVMSDPSICYRLLRLVNSALYALASPVSSIRAALMMIGDDEFRKVVTVAMANVVASQKARAAIQVALERARFCELIAPRMRVSASTLYLLGMLSLVDVILGLPMEQILHLLPLDRDLKAALLGQESPLTAALQFVQCYELGEWQESRAIALQLGLTETETSMLYIKAVRWADKVGKAC